MGGAIKSVVSSVTSGLGNIGASIIKSVAPKAIDLLKNVVGSGFDSLANVAKGLVSQIPFAGPLLSGLVDKLAPGLKNMATGGLEGFLNKLTNSITERLAPGTGQSVNLPPLAERAAQIAHQTSAASTGGASSVGADKPPARPSAEDMKDNNKFQQYQMDMQAYMQRRNDISEMMKQQADIAKAAHDAIMGLLQNIK